MFKKALLGLAVGALSLVAVVACTGQGSGSVPLASLSALGDASIQQTGIWVSGQGKVTAKPDLAILSLGVEARAKTVAEARTAAAESMNKVLAALDKGGVAEKDIQTRYFNIQPQYTYRDITDEFGRRSEQVLIGYIVTNQASVKVRNLETIGALIDSVTAAGGDLTRLNGISFTIENPTALQAQARELAVKDAMAKADQIAKSGNISLGKVFYITETSYAAPQPVRNVAMGAPAFDEAGGTSISTGELDVTVTVQAAYGIN